jgi:hypothetical protein
LLSSLLALGACTPASFQPRFTTPVAPTEPVVLQRLATNKPRDERAVVVGVTEDPMRLFAYDLQQGTLLWEKTVQLRSAPLVVADAIVAQEPDGVVVRDLASGNKRVLVDDGGQLVGADGRGKSLIVSIAYPDSSPRGADALVEGTHVRWKVKLSLPVGVPALADAYALVPWATQRLSVISIDDGTEIARWHFAHAVIGHVLIEDGRPYAGQQGLLPLDASTIANLGNEPALYTPQKRSLPGQPPLLRDGYLPIDEPDNAVHRLQLNWRPAPSAQGLHAENDQLLLRFYRILFALDARQDSVQWVRTFEHDLVGVAIQPGASIVADSAGVLRVLDPAGRTVATRELGRGLRVATIRPGAWVPAPAQGTSTSTDASTSTSASTSTAGGTAPAVPAADAVPATLHEQLVAAAALHDSRLSAGRAYAIELLGKLSDAAITGELIALCEDAKSPEPVQHAACDQLAQRSDGQAEVLAALARHASYLHDRSVPPLAALAPVAARLELQQAAPLLLAQLQDPATPVPALAPMIAALESLGHQAAAAPLERFVRLHHAEPEGSELQPAINAALHALGALHARALRTSLQAVAADALAPNATRLKAQEAIALLDAPPVNAKAAPKPEPEAAAPAPVVDNRPYALDGALVDASLGELKKPLAQCVSADPSRPRVGRVSMVVSGRGEVEGVFVTPTSLQACVEPVLRKARLPETRAGRQRVTYEIHGANAAPDESAQQPAPKHKPAKTQKPAAAAAPKPAAATHP